MGTQRQVILILGMHRSGTSALAGVVRLLGAATPGHLFEPTPANPTGYWESLPITTVNEAIFTTTGSAWFNPFAFDMAAFDAAERSDMVRLCLPVLHDEFGDAPTFVLKDPRFSLLLELWLPVFAAMPATVIPILALRHPAEVAASLHRRDAIPMEIGRAIWLHYTLEAERQTRGYARAVLSYNLLLRDWHAAMQRVAAATRLVWPVPPDSARAAIDDFLRPQLRHHHAAPSRATLGKPPLAGWLADTYAALCAIEDADDADACRCLDRVHGQFAEWRATMPHITPEMANGREPLPKTW